MAERRASRHNRCPLCKIQKSLCFCDEIKTFACNTKLSVIIHRKELFLPSNTVNLLKRNFPQLSMVSRGTPLDEEQNELILDENYYPLFLYPDENAVELNNELLSTISKPIQLIIPDGTWRQAKKMKRRTEQLSDVTSIKLTGDFKSTYSLRKQKYENGLSTYEAVAKALGIIESKELEQVMLQQFKIMNDRFSQTRPI
jgi:DTW domain-containing protein